MSLDTADQKRCPACAETILAAAVKCRFCGETFGGGQSSSPYGAISIVFGALSAIAPYFVALFLIPAALVTALMADKKGQRARAAVGIAFAMLGVLNVGYVNWELMRLLEPFQRR